MATRSKRAKRPAEGRPSPKKADLVEQISKALSKLGKDELTELVRKLESGELDLAELARPAPGSDGGPLRFGFQTRLREQRQ